MVYLFAESLSPIQSNQVEHTSFDRMSDNPPLCHHVSKLLLFHKG